MEFHKMDSAVRKHVVNNVFLPLELPQVEDQSGAEGGIFVRLVADVISEIVHDMDELKMIEGMMKSWGRVQRDFMDWKAVLQSIREVPRSAVYLPMQNAALTVSMNGALAATLAVFRVAARNAEVMGAPGALSGTFPGWSVTTDVDRVRNASFAKQVADMANHVFQEMVPLSRKAGASHGEDRDVVDAGYVTEWLVGAVAGHATITGTADVQRVKKKIRDDVLWKNGSRHPWRRSGEYMAVKVVLHTALVDRQGASDGLLAYKLIMLKFMSTFLLKYEFDTDVTLQMLSKVARRIAKLEEILAKPAWVELHLKAICELVIDVRGQLDERWRNIRNLDDSEITLDKSKLHFERDLHHGFRTAGPHLRVALGSGTSQLGNPKHYVPTCSRRNKSCGSWPDLNLLSSDDVSLYDIEVWVRDVLFLELQGHTDRPETLLFNLLVKYIDRAKRFYNGDCGGSSRMILTAITIVAVIDRLAGREFPLLLEYDTGVDISVLEFLLLPHRRDMKHLHKLELYYTRRLSERLYKMSLICEVRYGFESGLTSALMTCTSILGMNFFANTPFDIRRRGGKFEKI